MKKILLAGAALGFAMSSAQADILIATVGPMTGQYASFGEQMKTGAEQAVADINAAGGVNGEMLKLEIGDDACDPKQAVAVANQFAGSTALLFVAGHFCSGSSIPASAVYSDEKASSRSHRPRPTRSSPTSVRVGADGGTYRVCGRDDQQGAKPRRQVHARQTLQGQEDRFRSTTRPPTARVWPTPRMACLRSRLVESRPWYEVLHRW
jgi:branched-chain amino acid transport system substrate-binding protein